METPNKKPLGIEEAAEFLMVSTSFLYKLTSNGEIPHYKPGKRIVFLETDLLDFIQDNRVARRSSEEVRSKAAKHTMGMK